MSHKNQLLLKHAITELQVYTRIMIHKAELKGYLFAFVESEKE